MNTNSNDEAVDPSLSAVPMAHPHKPNRWEVAKGISIIAFGCFLSSIGIYYFYIPMKLSPGGMSGMASLLNARFGINPSLTLLYSNAFLLLCSFKVIGKDFALKTILGVLFVCLFLVLHEYFSSFFPCLSPEKLFHDKILASVFGGGLCGLGIGLVISRNGTTGGTEIAARMCNHFHPNYTIPQWLFVFDVMIVMLGVILFKSVEIGLYSTLALIISTYMINTVLTGINNSTGVYIISKSSHIISERVLLDMKRGATAFFGKGLYTGENKDIVFCVIRPRELPLLKSLVMEEDPNAFVAVVTVKDVLGNGFNPLTSPKIQRPVFINNEEEEENKKEKKGITSWWPLSRKK